MCFSASASFGAGIVLSVIGIATLRSVKQPAQIPFASLPLLFAVQQIAEGFLWLSFTNTNFEFLRTPSTYTFLFFAQVAWPAIVPTSILILKKPADRKLIPKLLAVIGGAIAVFLAYCLFTYDIEANAGGHHIAYKQDYPVSLKRFGAVLYISATILPPFFFKQKSMLILGVTILISYAITAIFYQGYILSVWCFFSAIMSCIIYFIINEINKQQKHRLAARKFIR